VEAAWEEFASSVIGSCDFARTAAIIMARFPAYEAKLGSTRGLQGKWLLSFEHSGPLLANDTFLVVPPLYLTRRITLNISDSKTI
jgi:hypothetical protein